MATWLVLNSEITFMQARLFVIIVQWIIQRATGTSIQINIRKIFEFLFLEGQKWKNCTRRSYKEKVIFPKAGRFETSKPFSSCIASFPNGVLIHVFVSPSLTAFIEAGSLCGGRVEVTEPSGGDWWGLTAAGRQDPGDHLSPPSL